MKLVISAVLAIGLAVFLALMAIQDPGYVVLAREPYTVRLPLALFVLGLLLAFALLYLFFNFLAGVFRAPKRVKKWNQNRNEQNAQIETMKGYAGLIEGEWGRAEDNLLNKLQHNKSPLLNLLGAAYAAQQQGHLRRRDQYLDEALQRNPKQQVAIGLTRARLQYQSGQVSDSRDTLEKLRSQAPKNIPAIRLLADVYQDLGDWPSLVALLPKIEKLKAFPEQEFNNREKLAYQHHLATPALTQANGETGDTWKALPNAKKKNPQAIASYARRLIRTGEMVEAEKVLRKALNRGWHDDLAYLYGKAETPHTDDQIKLVETWIRKYPDKPDLILTMARLRWRNNEMEEAQEMFKQAIAEGGREEAIAELGALLEDLGEKDAAMLCYKQGIAAMLPDQGLVEKPTETSGELVVLDESEKGMPVVSNG